MSIDGMIKMLLRRGLRVAMRHARTQGKAPKGPKAHSAQSNVRTARRAFNLLRRVGRSI